MSRQCWRETEMAQGWSLCLGGDKGVGGSSSPEPGAGGRPPVPNRFPGLRPCTLRSSGALEVWTQPSARPKCRSPRGPPQGGS